MGDQAFTEYLPHIRRCWLQEHADWPTRRVRAWEAARRATGVLRTQPSADAVSASELISRLSAQDRMLDL